MHECCFGGSKALLFESPPPPFVNMATRSERSSQRQTFRRIRRAGEAFRSVLLRSCVMRQLGESAFAESVCSNLVQARDKLRRLVASALGQLCRCPLCDQCCRTFAHSHP